MAHHYISIALEFEILHPNAVNPGATVTLPVLPLHRQIHSDVKLSSKNITERNALFSREALYTVPR
jgi:hypothetical protein